MGAEDDAPDRGCLAAASPCKDRGGEDLTKGLHKCWAHHCVSELYGIYLGHVSSRHILGDGVGRGLGR